MVLLALKGESVILPPCVEIQHWLDESGTTWKDMSPDNPLGRVEFRRRSADAVRAVREQAAGKAASKTQTGTAKFKLISVALCTVT